MTKILLVDSKQSDRENAERFLKSKGHDVITTYSAKTGLNLMNNTTFDIIVVDSTFISMKESCFDFFDLRNDKMIPNINIIVFCDETASMPIIIGNANMLKKRIKENHGYFISKKNDGLEALNKEIMHLTTFYENAA